MPIIPAADRQHAIFIYDRITVYFKHTDYYGFVHAYNYLEWMSYAREAFFKKIFPAFSGEDANQYNIVTTKVTHEYLSDAKFGDEIKIVIFTENVRRASFDVIFEFYVKADDKKLGAGRQTLVFLNTKTMRPTFINDNLYVEIKKGERIINERN